MGDVCMARCSLLMNAATEGDRNAMLHLAWGYPNRVLCHHHEGHFTDAQLSEKCMQWTRDAYKLGNADACFLLSSCLRHSDDVSTDALLKEGSIGGSIPCMISYAGRLWGRRLEKDEKSPDEIEALYWYQRAARHQSVEAVYKMASKYYLHKKRDYTTYATLLESVTHARVDQLEHDEYRSYKKCFIALAACYEKGIGVDRDYTTALTYYKRASELGELCTRDIERLQSTLARLSTLLCRSLVRKQ